MLASKKVHLGNNEKTVPGFYRPKGHISGKPTYNIQGIKKGCHPLIKTHSLNTKHESTLNKRKRCSSQKLFQQLALVRHPPSDHSLLGLLENLKLQMTLSKIKEVIAPMNNEGVGGVLTVRRYSVPSYPVSSGSYQTAQFSSIDYSFQ